MCVASVFIAFRHAYYLPLTRLAFAAIFVARKTVAVYRGP